MPVITLYDEITGTAAEDGTWVYTGTTTPNPTAPATWDGTIDTSGYANGEYEYSYTVQDSSGIKCSQTSVLTINILSGLTPNGDTNLNPILLSNLTLPGDSSNLEAQTLLGECPGVAAPGLSELELPTSWTASYSSDLYYRVDISGISGTIENLSVTVSSSGYPNPLTSPYIALYTTTSSGSILYDSGPINTTTATASYTDVSGLSGSFYIRVSSASGNEGNFGITVTAY